MPTSSETPRDPNMRVSSYTSSVAGAASVVRRAFDAVAEALSAPTINREAVRRAAVRYGAAARDLAMPSDEMVGALRALVPHCLGTREPGLCSELSASVPWWAVHGYHRAD